MTWRRRALFGLVLVAALALTRVPLHRATHALPVSNDDAIPLLIATHVLQGEHSTILWNQPYNGTLDAYLLAPLVRALGAHAAFRFYEAACGVLLIAAVGVLAALAAGEAAGWLAALLAAWGTPYMALMAATGPTPNFLVPLLAAGVAVVGLCRKDGRWESPAVAWLAGLVAGLATWDSALALPPLLGIGAGLWLAGLRPRLVRAITFAAGFALGAGPLLLARAVGASGSSSVTALRPRWLWWAGARDLARAAAGLFGLQVPLVVDGPERAALPPALAVLLGVGLLVLAAWGARERRAWPLAGWALALAGAFAASRRTGGDEIRYLFGLVVPVLALAGAGARRLKAAGPVLALVLLGAWLAGHRLLLAQWRLPDHAARVWQVPPLDPVRETLRRAGVRSAYASLQFAGRLTLETGGAVVASQAWNERIPGDPLRFRDEVDLDPRAAWVLSPHLSRGMPRAAGLRDLLAELGGGYKEDLPGDFAVFRRFVPPYDEARPVPRAALAAATIDGMKLGAAVLDRDVETWWQAPSGIGRGSGVAVTVTPPRRLSAVAFLVDIDLDRSPLATPWVAEADGALVARGPARHGFQWVNGAPRAGKQALLVVPLGDRTAGTVRLLFQGEGPVLRVGEVFAYGPDEAVRPESSEGTAGQALEAARGGAWARAAALYRQAAAQDPDRAGLQACLVRALWRAARRQRLDVESLDDGGDALVGARP